MPKIKNILIFVGIAALLILIYFFFIKSDPDEASLVSSESSSTFPDINTSASATPQITQDFLSILLNIKSIKLDDSIFSDTAFLSLRDSSILLTPDGNEGRPNPFAPIGSDNIIVSTAPSAVPLSVLEGGNGAEETAN